MIAALTLIFSIMTSYARARAESLVEKCKVGFMERPERIVLFMIGAFTNRMAGVLWVILVLSILAVANRIYYTYLALNKLPMPSREGVAGVFNRAFFWTDERATLPYDLWVIAILAFVWLMPPDWLGDPMAHDPGLIAWVARQNLELGIWNLEFVTLALRRFAARARPPSSCHALPLVLDDRRHNRDQLIAFVDQALACGCAPIRHRDRRVSESTTRAPP